MPNKIIFILVLLYSVSFAADINSTKQNGYIDQAHEMISDKTESISTGIDNFLANRIDFFLSSYKEENGNIRPAQVDRLFQNEKFLNETRKSFLKFSTNYRYNSLDENKLSETVSANLGLNRSNEKFKLFINNLNQDNINDMTEKSETSNDKPEIGLSFFQNINKNTESKYSLGTRGFYPFARARFAYKKDLDNWKVEPVQSFEYSIKDHFKEYTILYLDRSLSEKILFRVEFQRGSGSKISGMDYDSVIHLFWTKSDKEGLQLSQGFYGNTKYIYTSQKTGSSGTFRGINNYVTQLTYRRNILRKWFFYELSPGINFSKAHDFRPNYTIFAKFDIIFGKI